MRWLKKPVEGNLGNMRTRRKFLWWPRCFDGREVRWLEFADVQEQVKRMDVGGSVQWGQYAYQWREIGWGNKTDGKLKTEEGHARQDSDLGGTNRGTSNRSGGPFRSQADGEEGVGGTQAPS